MGTSPLLADLIRRTADARLREAGVALVVIAAAEDLTSARKSLAGLEADVAVVAAASADADAVTGAPWPVLVLSADLTLENLAGQLIEASGLGKA